MKKHLFFGLLFLLIISCTLSKSQESTTPIPLDPELRYGKLENGFTYYIRDTGDLTLSDKPGISLQLIGPGNRFEDMDQIGLAHLIEHMLIRTNTSHFKPFYESYYENKDLLAYRRDFQMQTGTYRVIYSWGIPPNNDELLSQELGRIREFAQDEQVLKNLQDSEKVDGQGRETVLEEYYRFEDPNRWEKVFKILNEPYGHRFADRNISYYRHNKNIKEFSLESLVRFYKDWYRPDKLALVVVGDVDADQVEKQVKKLFSDLKTPDNAPNKPLDEFQEQMRIPLPGERNVFTLIDSTQNEIELEFYFKRAATEIGGAISSEQQYKRRLIEQLFDTMLNTRFKSLFKQYNSPIKGFPSLTIKSELFTTSQIKAVNILSRVQNISSISEAAQSILTELERVRRHGFTVTELERAKKEVMENIGYYDRIRLTELYEKHFLFGAVPPHPENEKKLATRLIETVTLDELKDMGQYWLEAPDQDVVMTLPREVDAQHLPTNTTIAKWVKRVRNGNIEPYSDKDHSGPHQLLSDKEMEELTGNVSYNQTKVEEIDVTTLQLDNGMQFILKPIKNSDKIYLKGNGPGGTSLMEREELIALRKAPGIVLNGGAGGYDKFDLARYNKRKKIDLHLAVGTNETIIQGAANPEHIENLLQEIYLYCSAPNRNEQAFTDWLTREKLILSKNSNSNKFRDLVNREILGTEDVEITQQDLDRIELEKALALYRNTFSDLSKFTFVIAGDFDIEQMKSLLLRYLGNLNIPNQSLPFQKHVEQNPTIKKTVQGIYKTFYTGDDSDDYFISINFLGKYKQDEKEKLKLEVLNEIIGTSSLLKGRETGLYSPLMFVLTFDTNSFRFISNYQAKEHDILEKVKKAINSVANDIRENGPNTTHFHNAIEKIKSQQKDYFSDKADPRLWADYLLDQYQREKDYKAITKRQNVLENITLKDIRETAQRYLSSENLSIIEMLPEKEKNRKVNKSYNVQ